MPRKQRIHYSEAFYHVMLRGNYCQPVFNDDEDRLQFYVFFEDSIKKFNCRVHLFCLMTNHIHAVVEVNHVPLWKIIQSLASRFSNYKNKKNNLAGHLFQGRYKAKIIQNEKYLLELCYYIHSNPIKAYMVNSMNDYKWSSHSAYIGKSDTAWVTTNYINTILKKYSEDKENWYSKFMQSKEKILDDVSYCNFDAEGNLTITDSVNKKMNLNKFVDFSHLSIFEIATIVCNNLQISIEELSSSSQNRKIVLTRSIVTYFCHYYAHYYLKEIASFLLRNSDSISRSMHQQLKLGNQGEPIKMLMYKIEKDLKNALK